MQLYKLYKKAEEGQTVKLPSIGTLDSVCDWPWFNASGNTFRSAISVRELPQFKINGKLQVTCQVQDVTVSSASFPCAKNQAETIASKSFETRPFDFKPVFRPFESVIKLNAISSTAATTKVYYGGANPAFDLFVDYAAFCSFFKAFYMTFIADGVFVEAVLKGDKEDMGYGSGLDYFLAFGAALYGTTTFGLQLWADVFYFKVLLFEDTLTSAAEKL